MLVLLVSFASLVRAGNAQDTVAMNNIGASTTMPLVVGYPPCSQVGFTCVNGRVVALSMSGTLKTGQAFPDITGFQKLTSLTFNSGWSFTNNGLDLSALAWLRTLTDFAVVGNPTSLSTYLQWGANALPVGTGANWTLLQTFQLLNVKNFLPLPGDVTGWIALQEMSLTNVAITGPMSQFGLPLDLTSWKSLEIFEIHNVVMQNQNLPVFGTLPKILSYSVFMLSSMGNFVDANLFSSPSLESFSIITCATTGGVLPTTVGNAIGLLSFTIRNTAMTGVVTPSFTKLKHLESYILGGAGFGGTLPTNIGLAKNLTALHLLGVTVSGSIPSQIGLLSSLQDLVIVEAVLPPKLTGTFPVEVFELINQNLQFIDIENTQVGGQLPNFQLDNPPNLPATLKLKNNQFCGALPQWFIEVAPEALTCDVSGNFFCFDPNPMTTAQKTNCHFSIATAPLQCGICPTCNATAQCTDCMGNVDGSVVYDLCDVCGGDGMSCLDCNGVPHGTAKYDQCSICNGDNFCLDCAGTINGTAKYDRCGVCDGDGSSCIDCLGHPFGTARIDECGLCNGDNLSCQDCSGVFNGSLEYDACGNCVNFSSPDYHPRCYDCFGVLNGPAVRDVCNVCRNASHLHPHHYDHTEHECDPDEIVAGVSGLQIVVPFDISLGAIILILLIVYLILRVRSPSSTPSPTSRRLFGGAFGADGVHAPPPSKEFPIEKFQ